MLNMNVHLQLEVTCFWIWTQQQRDHAQSNWTKSTKSEEFVPICSQIAPAERILRPIDLTV